MQDKKERASSDKQRSNKDIASRSVHDFCQSPA